MIDINLKVKSATTTELMLDIEDIAVNFTELVVLYQEKEGQKTWKISPVSSTNITIRGLRPFKQYEARAVGYFDDIVYNSQLVTVGTQKRKCSHLYKITENILLIYILKTYSFYSVE